ncbi:2Fe-2S iron-sulfur cluster-binding protein [Xylophilus sp.]|uniref:2Fe-2S iron-sulfur cluster-binding protein n=1 Tax=Xylophilus sp. TaxID=2653893 RepID=UPI0013B92CFB|nr:2Fe-2S iron-sulfur cluster-binding protein [Xylophilus sp.]KAF1050123.1 MAG: hypothetical protein GAK38_00148 [Xylophilus sp.]
MRIHLTLYRDGAPRRIDVDLPPAREAGLGLTEWEGASVSTALQVLQRTLDPRIGYVLSCRRGLCKVCAMRIDGEVQTACTVPLHDGITIEPAKERLALLDTVVELSLVRKARAPAAPH